MGTLLPTLRDSGELRNRFGSFILARPVTHPDVQMSRGRPSMSLGMAGLGLATMVHFRSCSGT